MELNEKRPTNKESISLFRSAVQCVYYSEKKKYSVPDIKKQTYLNYHINEYVYQHLMTFVDELEKNIRT